jgi:hypothetical protein
MFNKLAKIDGVRRTALAHHNNDCWNPDPATPSRYARRDRLTCHWQLGADGNRLESHWEIGPAHETEAPSPGVMIRRVACRFGREPATQ